MTRRLSLLLLVVVSGVSLSLSLQAQQRPADWTQWRGPNRDGAAPFTPPASWPDKLTQKWKHEVGSGYATPLVVGNRVYVFARQGDNEVMMALDADTGKEVWKNAGSFRPPCSIGSCPKNSLCPMLVALKVLVSMMSAPASRKRRWMSQMVFGWVRE